MADNSVSWWRLFAMQNDDPRKAVGMTVLVAFVAALGVSTAATVLKPYQQVHVERERQARLDAMLNTLPGLRDLMVEAGIDMLETRIVDLQSGQYDPVMDPAAFDPVAAAKDSATSRDLPPDADPAGLKRIATHAPVYLLEREGRLHLIVLPVSGTGYQSLIRAYLALEPDLTTVAALTIVEQAETPGIGARITEPDWQALWPGHRIADEDGRIMIRVAQGAEGPYEVDGISGATRTGNGITAMLTFWLGDQGFGPFLDRLRDGGA